MSVKAPSKGSSPGQVATPSAKSSSPGAVPAATGSARPATRKATLVMGALLPQSGDLNAIYKSLATPVQMAVAEINNGGGVNGKQVTLKIMRETGQSEIKVTTIAQPSSLD